MRLSIDLPARLLPYLRLREVAVLASTCSRSEGIAAARHHVALGLWARLGQQLCRVSVSWHRQEALEWWDFLFEWSAPPLGLQPYEFFPAATLFRLNQFHRGDTERGSQSSEYEEPIPWSRPRPARRYSWP